MKCVFCGRIRRFVVAMMPADVQTALATERSKLLDWAYTQANDAEIWCAEREQKQVAAAIELDGVDRVSAFHEFLALAERGSLWSMVRVGYHYQVGRGTSLDIEKAEHWYRLAVDGGVQQAQLRLGKLYWCRKDFARAAEVYQVGAGQKWSPAMYRLAQCKLAMSRSRQTLSEARQLLEAASEKGDLGAELYLASLITRGRFGLRQIPRGWRRFREADRKISIQLGEFAPSWTR